MSLTTVCSAKALHRHGTSSPKRHPQATMLRMTGCAIHLMTLSVNLGESMLMNGRANISICNARGG